MATTTRKTATKTTRAKKTVKEELPVQETLLEEAEAPKQGEKPQAATFTADDVQRMIAEALQKQQEAFAAQMQSVQPQVVQVMQDTEKVVLRFQAEVADDNEAVFGSNGYYGKITGKRGILTIPKSEFTSRFMDANVQWMLKERWLVVLSGLTEDEREMYGVNYKPGELIDEKAFGKLSELTNEELIDMFPGLCVPHREMLARRLVTTYMQHGQPNRDWRGLASKLNEISKKDYAGVPEWDARRKGAFAPILEDLNKQGV